MQAGHAWRAQSGDLQARCVFGSGAAFRCPRRHRAPKGPSWRTLRPGPGRSSRPGLGSARASPPAGFIDGGVPGFHGSAVTGYAKNPSLAPHRPVAFAPRGCICPTATLRDHLAHMIDNTPKPSNPVGQSVLREPLEVPDVREVADVVETIYSSADYAHHRLEDNHKHRYIESLSRVPMAKPGARVLEVGTSPVVWKTLTEVHGFETVDFTEYTPGTPFTERKSYGFTDGQTVAVHFLDLAEAHASIDTASYDIVLAWEVIEHFRLDPAFFLCEINRWLKFNGLVILTTPNIASIRALEKQFAYLNPGLYTKFHVSENGIKRHQYEFAPVTRRHHETRRLQADEFRDIRCLWQSERRGPHDPVCGGRGHRPEGRHDFLDGAEEAVEDPPVQPLSLRSR